MPRWRGGARHAPDCSSPWRLQARIVLSRGQGRTNLQGAAESGATGSTVARWRTRFIADRLDGLGDTPVGRV